MWFSIISVFEEGSQDFGTTLPKANVPGYGLHPKNHFQGYLVMVGSEDEWRGCGMVVVRKVQTWSGHENAKKGWFYEVTGGVAAEGTEEEHSILASQENRNIFTSPAGSQRRLWSSSVVYEEDGSPNGQSRHKYGFVYSSRTELARHQWTVIRSSVQSGPLYVFHVAL